jgi:hypothetical protein
MLEINYLKSRRKALLIFMSILSFFLVIYFSQLLGWGSVNSMYWLCGGLGFGSGFSVLYITMSAEQFGTNLRATAATTIPNMVRGALPLINFLFLRADNHAQYEIRVYADKMLDTVKKWVPITYQAFMDYRSKFGEIVPMKSRTQVGWAFTVFCANHFILNWRVGR